MSRSLARLFLGLSLATAAAVAAERPLTVDHALSRIQADVKATGHSFTARLGQFDAAIGVAGDGQVSSAKVSFKFAELVTGKEKRDKEMHAWQQTTSFPDVSFVLTSLEPAGNATAGWNAIGRLTLHGTTREVRFPISILRDNARTVIDGAVPLDTREYGLPVIRMMAVLKVDPIVQVSFHLEGQAGR